MVERYEVVGSSAIDLYAEGVMLSVVDGEWVKFSDYELLRKELEELKTVVKA